jgi:drug/metabolite transporter (DMT)-like permease
VFGMSLSAIFLHERITIFQIIAVGLMLFGIYLINQNNTPDGTKIRIKNTRT